MTAPKRTSWSRPVNLTDALAGGPPPAPQIGRWSDSADGKAVKRALFYPNEVHSVGGEPEAMKSWLLLYSAAQEIDLGKHVIYVDMEANDRSVVDRLRLLGGDRRSIKKFFHYMRPDDQLTEADQRAFRAMVTRLQPTLVVLDGVTEAYSLHGLSINAAEDAANWFQRFSRQFQVQPTEGYDGPAIVELDHVIKSRDDRNGWTIGTQHKKAGIKGAMYIVESVAPFGKGKHGRSRLMLSKDSPGGVEWVPFGKNRQRYVGDLHCDASGDGVGVVAWIESADVSEAPDPEADLPLTEQYDFRVLMQEVCTFIGANPSASLRLIRGGVKGTNDRIALAVEQLCRDGFVLNEGSTTRGKYVVQKEFNAIRVVRGGAK